MSTPDGTPSSCWRVFPWEPAAREGTRFSPSYIPEPTGRGRFDLPRSLSPVLYSAETPDHAVGELLQPWRGRSLQPFHLLRAGFPLAVVEVTVPASVTDSLADLCDADYLAGTRTGPDTAASRFRHLTQPVARAAWEAGHTGVRWWSSFWGDWHTVVLFIARMRGRLGFGTPEVLTPHHPAVLKAADLLGMRVP